MKPARWQFALGLGLAVALLAFSLRSVDFTSVLDSLRNAQYWLLLPAFVLTLTAFYLRALRWGILLRSVKHISGPSLFSATLIGFAANNLLPARIGELIRAWAIGRQEQISRSSAFATVVLERIVDVFSLLFFFGLTLLLHPFPTEARRGGWIALGLNVLLLIGLYWAERNPDKVGTMGTWLAQHAPARFRDRIQSLFDNFVIGLGILRHGSAVLPLVLYSLALYGVTILGIHTCLMAFSFSFPWYASIVLLVTLTLGFIIAPTPGYVGAIQVASVETLALFGVDRGAAFSFSIFYHVSQYLPITLGGLWYLARQGLSLGRAASAAGEEVGEQA